MLLSLTTAYCAINNLILLHANNALILILFSTYKARVYYLPSSLSLSSLSSSASLPFFSFPATLSPLSSSPFFLPCPLLPPHFLFSPSPLHLSSHPFSSPLLASPPLPSPFSSPLPPRIHTPLLSSPLLSSSLLSSPN